MSTTRTSATGWTITASPNPGRDTWTLKAISPSRQRVITTDKVLDPEAFDPDKYWSNR